MSKYVFSVKGRNTYLNGKELLIKGLRCSNALYSEESADQLARQLKVYAEHGLNTVSVFFMGNRFGDIKGYNEDCKLNPVYTARMGRIIEAADELGMVVIVGCLYWGESKSKWGSWTQKEANEAVKNTVMWLKENNYRNVYIDVDNEGMARREKGFDTREMVLAAKSVDPSYMVASNFVGLPPEEADLGVHFSDKDPNKPYVESEGVPENAPGGYWMKFSRAQGENPYDFMRKNTNFTPGVIGYNNYINIGLYTEEMKLDQINRAKNYWDDGLGYMLASTWLQAVPPFGPNHTLGGYGSLTDPGVRWFADFVKETYGPYKP